MNSNRLDFLRLTQQNPCSTICLNRDTLSGALIANQISGNDVTVRSRRQSGLQLAVQGITRFVVDNDKGPVAARERHLVMAIVPPVLKRLEVRNVTESDHVSDWMPSAVNAM